MGDRERDDPKPFGDPAAPADIGLQDIGGTGGEHGRKTQVVAAFACEAAQARPVVGADS